MNAPEVSIVIPARNASSTIEYQLESLAAQTYRGNWELIVVDNGSTDPTRSAVERFAGRLPVRVVDASEEVGINRARNVGVRSSRGDLIAVCDADDICAPTWLQALVNGLESFDIVGGALDETALNRPTTQAWRPGRPTHRLPVALGYLPYAIGANLGFHRPVWEDVGGFDENAARGATEIDFCWRAQEAGYELGYVAEAVVHYRLRTSLAGTAVQAYWYGRGDVRLARSRHLPRPVRHPISRLLEPPNEPNVRWWQWMPGRLSYAAGYAVGTVTETLAEVG